MSNTSRNARKQSRKLLLALLAIGLAITLFLKAMMTKAAPNKKSLNSDVFKGTEYEPYTWWIISQARHETANFTSNVYLANNNPMGMKVPSVRKFLGTTGTKAPDGGYYAKYINDTQGFQDFLVWLRARKFPTGLQTVEQYVQAMKDKGYFGDSTDNYLRGVKFWMAKYSY
jgi:hypothetical protein